MNKPVVGIVVGAVLGFIDGATAWFTPGRPLHDGRHSDGFERQRDGGGCAVRHVRAQGALHGAGIALGAVLGLIFA